MKRNTTIVERRQEEIDRRLDPDWQPETATPVFSGPPITYEMSERVKAITCGGLGLIIQLVEHIGLAETINKRLHLLKRHLPSHESDHLLNLAYNILVSGKSLDDLDQLRQDPAYMDAVGAERIPASTTAGDYLRRGLSGAYVGRQEQPSTQAGKQALTSLAAYAGRSRTGREE